MKSKLLFAERNVYYEKKDFGRILCRHDRLHVPHCILCLHITLKDAADWKSTYSSQYDWFISYYLDQMEKAEETAGKRLIDVIDLHYYSDVKGDNDCRVTDCKDNPHTSCIETRMQDVRTLYDESYVENSWIGQWYQSFLPIPPTIWESIDTYYPGTKHAISEYNFGGGDHISGAIAEADALGTFASHNVYMAALWPLTKDFSHQLSAINLYTNYDGEGASFGDTLIPSLAAWPGIWQPSSMATGIRH